MEPKQNIKSSIVMIFGTAIVVVLFFLYLPVFVNVFKELYNNEDYSFGLLIPFVGGYILYLKWPMIRGYSRLPSWWGTIFIAVGLFLYMIGKMTADRYTPPFSFVIVITGLIICLGGWGFVRLFAFPLLLLLLMIPLPTLILTKITAPLQLLSSQLATTFLQTIGIPAVRQGNVIDLGVRQLEVVAACSGLRYILSLLALGLIFCYFYQRRHWKAAILIISFVPLSIIANTIRVAAAGIYPPLQQGFLHDFSGWLIFLFCFGFFAFLNYLLNCLWPPTEEVQKEENDVGKVSLHTAVGSSTPYLIGSLIILLVGTVAVRTIGSPPPVPLLQSFDNFPMQLGPWQGHRTYIDPKIFEKTQSDSYLDAEFASKESLPISLYIAYYETQSATGALGHNPGVCMTGSGWQTLNSGITEVSPGFPVNYLVLQQAGTRLLVYWWNMNQGHWMALSNASLYKLYTIINAIRNHRTDWALVRLITPIANEPTDAKERLSSFSRLLAPVLPKFIPE